MIRWFLRLIFFLFLVTFPLNAQIFDLITPPILNMGTTIEDTVVSGIIKFKNTGDDILKIGRIQTTCGCTVAELSKTEYAPGERGEIEVYFNTKGYGGTLARKSVMIHMEQGTPARVRVDIQTEVKALLEVEPRFINLQDLSLTTDTLEQSLTITNNYNRDMAVTDLYTNIDDLDISVDEFTLKPGDSQNVVIRPIMNKPIRVNGYIDIRISEPVERTKRVPVFIKLDP